MIIVNISMNPAEYGDLVTNSRAARIARAIDRAVQKKFPDVFTVFKLEPSSVMSSDGTDKKEMIDEVRSWLDKTQASIAALI